MRLLIVTQKVDRKDPILGFFHRWLIEFSRRFDQLVVIAQSKGDYDLPDNVRVISLGKEAGKSKLGQILRFIKLIWSERKNYDQVLVHMTPIWVVLGGLSWLLMRKKLYLWYEIKRGSWKLSIALKLVKKVFSASVQGLPKPSKKQIVVGHGIDIAKFDMKEGQRDNNLILSVGRITNSKHYEVILNAFAKLPENYRLQIAGGTIRKDDEEKKRKLEGLMEKLGIRNQVVIKWVDPEAMVDLYNQSILLLNACEGGLDKAILEAMACGCLVVSSAQASKDVLPEECFCSDAEMGKRINGMLGMSEVEHNKLRSELRSIVVRDHSLERLVGRLVKEMN